MKFGRLFWGLLVVAFGIILMGINLGFWTNDVFDTLFRLWPLLLILIGVNLVFGEKNPVALILLVLTLIFGTLYAVDYRGLQEKITPEASKTSSTVKNQPFSYDLPESVKNAEYRINIGAANIKVDTIEGAKLYEGYFDSTSEIKLDNSVTGDTARVIFDEKNQHFSFSGNNDMRRELNLNLNQEIMSKLVINSGASKIDMNLTELKLTELDIDAGASSQEIRLGSKVDKVKVDISAGASKINLNLPKDFAVKLDSDSALSTVTFNNIKLSKEGSIYKSDNYDSAVKQITIRISAGVSTVNLSQD